MSPTNTMPGANNVVRALAGMLKNALSEIDRPPSIAERVSSVEAI